MSSSPVPAPEASIVILWAGENPVLHTALLEQLDIAGIPYVDKPIGEDEAAPTADPLPIDWKPRFGFQVAVLSTDLARAQALLEPLLELEHEPLAELPAEDDASAASEEAPLPAKKNPPRFRFGRVTSRNARASSWNLSAKTKSPRARKLTRSKRRSSFRQHVNPALAKSSAR